MKLVTGGSIGPIKVLKLLFSEICKIDYNSTTTKAREKIRTYLEALELLTIEECVLDTNEGKQLS
jgi:hypothetical protein